MAIPIQVNPAGAQISWGIPGQDLAPMISFAVEFKLAIPALLEALAAYEPNAAHEETLSLVDRSCRDAVTNPADLFEPDNDRAAPSTDKAERLRLSEEARMGADIMSRSRAAPRLLNGENGNDGADGASFARSASVPSPRRRNRRRNRRRGHQSDADSNDEDGPQPEEFSPPKILQREAPAQRTIPQPPAHAPPPSVNWQPDLMQGPGLPPGTHDDYQMAYQQWVTLNSIFGNPWQWQPAPADSLEAMIVPEQMLGPGDVNKPLPSSKQPQQWLDAGVPLGIEQAGAPSDAVAAHGAPGAAREKDSLIQQAQEIKDALQMASWPRQEDVSPPPGLQRVWDESTERRPSKETLATPAAKGEALITECDEDAIHAEAELDDDHEDDDTSRPSSEETKEDPEERIKTDDESSHEEEKEKEDDNDMDVSGMTMDRTDTPTDTTWIVVSKEQLGTFSSPNGVSIDDARRLEQAVLRALADGKPRNLGHIACIDYGTGRLRRQFDEIFTKEGGIDESRTWKKWLASLPDIEMVCEEEKSTTGGFLSQPTHARLRDGANSKNRANSKNHLTNGCQDSGEEPEKEEQSHGGDDDDGWAPTKNAEDWIVAEKENTTFSAPYGMGTQKARQLERDVLDLLADGEPVNISTLRAKGNVGMRFNWLFWQKNSVNNGSWKKWLASLQNTELLYDRRLVSKTGWLPSAIRLRKDASTDVQEEATSTRESKFEMLLGDWYCGEGSHYLVTECTETTHTVKITRRSGAVETRRGCINQRDGDVFWGGGFRMTHLSKDSLTWAGTRKSYEWTRKHVEKEHKRRDAWRQKHSSA